MQALGDGAALVARLAGRAVHAPTPRGHAGTVVGALAAQALAQRARRRDRCRDGS
jgi:hypothetical protein